MPLLNTASKVYSGSTLAARVYRGTAQVWPPAVTQWSAHTTQLPSGQTTAPGWEVGTRITLAQAGNIIALRLWRDGTGQTARTLRLWNIATGLQIGSVVTSGETGSGWKQHTLPTPVAVTAGQQVAVSFNVTSPGYIVIDSNSILPITNGPVTATSACRNFTTSGTFPGSDWLTRDVFTDVVFTPGAG